MDYYEILGISRHSTDDEIKSAYRKLALKLHPDKHPPEERETYEAKFRDISEAYSVLSDASKRQMYDQFGREGLNMDSSVGGGAAMDPRDIFQNFFNFGGSGGDDDGDVVETIAVSLEKIYTGCTINHTYSRNVKCERCEGTGNRDKIDRTCKKCHGTRMVTITKQMGIMLQQYRVRCNCDDTASSKPDQRCRDCVGKKCITDICHIEIRVPVGATADQPIVYDGRGNYHNGTYHKLIVRIVERPHRHFKRGVGIRDVCPPNALNLVHQKEIDVLTVLLRQPISIPSIEHPTTDLYIIPNLSNLTRGIVVIPGHGMKDAYGTRGDLIVIFSIVNTSLTVDQLDGLQRLFPRSVVSIPAGARVTPCETADPESSPAVGAHASAAAAAAAAHNASASFHQQCQQQ